VREPYDEVSRAQKALLRREVQGDGESVRGGTAVQGDRILAVEGCNRSRATMITSSSSE